MVNRLRKGLWFLLIVFLAYFSSPGYPDSKKKTIHNLPVNQDMGVFFQSYPKSDEDQKLLEAMDGADACTACQDDLNDAAKCKRCVRLRKNCGDCCLTKDKKGKEAVRCSVKDDKEYNYDCRPVPFDGDDCEQVICDEDKCISDCEDYPYAEFEDDGITRTACYGTKGTGGEVDSSAKPLRWQKKGCPDDLTPSDCSVYKKVSNIDFIDEVGPESVWECSHSSDRASSLVPQITPCSINAETGLTEPDSNYYQFYEYVWGHEYSCSGTECCGCSYQDPGQPSCDSSLSTCSAVKSYTCNNSCCTAWGPCSPSPCTPPCRSTCVASVNCTSTPKIIAVRYKLSDVFKDYIEKCVDKANAYDTCTDRMSCCEEGVCPDEVVKKNDGTYECNPGFPENCDDCDKRICYADDCADFGAATSCPQIASDANGCLIDHSDCFKEIDGAFFYPYVARSGDALNIIWQVVTKKPKKVVDGLSFYTLVKVWKLDAYGNPEKAVHTSMMNVKSLEASFSIYGTTNVAKGKLDAGASYQARLYYFLPPRKFCKVECECPDEDDDCMAEACEDTNNIELTYLSLILQRIRE